jgi:BAR domain-containing protein
MNVNKKFDRFKQWAGEKMGGEAKTNTSDDFKMLEMEMNLRHEGIMAQRVNRRPCRAFAKYVSQEWTGFTNP